MVSWNDAAEFCAKLSKQEKLRPFYFRAGETITPVDGTGYRLPTEAEWEFACRAGTLTKYWISDENEDLVRAGWFGTNFGAQTQAAGVLKANPFGLYDIHGNVWEWVQDWWEPTYYGQFQAKPALDPDVRSSTGFRRVIRGGSWAVPASLCRASSRGASGPSAHDLPIGFRVSLVVDAVRQALKVTGPAMPKPVATTPSTPASDFAADRHAAEYVLSISGSITVRLNEQDRLCKFTTDLPREPFRLTQVDLRASEHSGATWGDGRLARCVSSL